MFLYLIRHAWAGDYGASGHDDSFRELTAEGKERFAKVVEAVVGRGFAPRHVATSPYARCRQTAEIVAEHVADNPEVVPLEALEPGSDIAAAIEWTRSYSGQDVAWCGHNPDMEILAGLLIGDRQANIRFAKGTIAAIQFDGDIELAQGQLYWLATAKLLGV
jgi:phosphohistidine phosphatase SixA